VGLAVELDAEALLAAAREARRHAYAPYSHFPVGAALLDGAGRVHIGVNVENASYALATCAERSAVARAISDGVREFVAIAVAGPADDRACMPCGSCRQILHEIAPALRIVVAGAGGAPLVFSLPALLPHAFGSAALAEPVEDPR
jgi:cytidine deaminase